MKCFGLIIVYLLFGHVFLTKNLFVWKLHSCNLADGSSLPNFTCWIPPQAVFTRWVTNIWCAMVTERLLVNIRLRLWATWPFKYEDGWRVCVGGELFTISRKTRIEILRVASTLKYTNSSFQHFPCPSWKWNHQPCYYTPNNFCTIILQFNVCGTEQI